jgi:hypothetical protein
MASQLHIKDGHQLSEPPSIEGYVSRIRSASGSREEVYLTVHNGLLFTLAASHAHTPNLLGVVPVPHGADHDIRDALREEEVRRGAAQVLAARCVMDLRAVVAVRRAFRPHFHPSQPVHNSTPRNPEEDEQRLDVEVAQEESDALDAGGDTGLTGNVTTMRMRRCFELVTKTGHIIRFEVRPNQTHGRADDDECGRPGRPKSRYSGSNVSVLSFGIGNYVILWTHGRKWTLYIWPRVDHALRRIAYGMTRTTRTAHQNRPRTLPSLYPTSGQCITGASTKDADRSPNVGEFT